MSPVMRTKHSTPAHSSFSAATEESEKMSTSWELAGWSGWAPGESLSIPVSKEGFGGGGGDPCFSRSCPEGS